MSEEKKSGCGATFKARCDDTKEEKRVDIAVHDEWDTKRTPAQCEIPADHIKKGVTKKIEQGEYNGIEEDRYTKCKIKTVEDAQEID